MSNPNMIEVGDIVTVDFAVSGSINPAEVIKKPQDTGDCWGLRTGDGAVINVMHFERMDLVKKGPVNDAF